MSHENVDLVRRGIESPDSFFALFDEHVVLDARNVTTLIDLDGVYVGREAVIEACRHYWGTWDDYALEAEDLIDAGQSVVVVVRERGKGKGSGAPFENHWAQVWTFRDGRMIRWEAFLDRATALEAVGLQE